jgi:hypothetical protein
MRPRAIQVVPGLNPNATPFERFEEFGRHIAAVPKSEVSKNGKNGKKINKSGETGSKKKRSKPERSKGGLAMSDKLLKNLHELSHSVHENAARVEQELSNGKSKPDSAIVTSAAKYRKALEMLSHE